MRQWPLQDAKNKFSALVDAALAGECQQVTRRGKPAVVVMSVDEYNRLRNRPAETASSFIEHLLAIPGDDDGLEFERIPIAARSLEL